MDQCVSHRALLHSHTHCVLRCRMAHMTRNGNQSENNVELSAIGANKFIWNRRVGLNVFANGFVSGFKANTLNGHYIKAAHKTPHCTYNCIEMDRHDHIIRIGVDMMLSPLPSLFLVLHLYSALFFSVVLSRHDWRMCALNFEAGNIRARAFARSLTHAHSTHDFGAVLNN